MTTIATPERERTGTRAMLNKVPEVTIWFWIIKILCTTVGESFADWVDLHLGVGLEYTSLIFTGVLVATLAWQFRTTRYQPITYWLTVVTLSVTGTLYTDVLTDDLHVPLAISSGVFAGALAVVFGIWWARERTLSIHSITTTPREAFYWLAVLVTFALGTAAGDWTLELTGWGPGTSVLLPASLITAIALGRGLGANAVLSFWLAYILTRPLGANLGDWLASAKTDGGLGAGTAITSGLFLAAVLATVAYLALTHNDVTAEHQTAEIPHTTGKAMRERIALGYYTLVAIGAALVMTWAAARPHTTPAAADDGASSSAPSSPAPAVQLAPKQATAHFPTGTIARYRSITADTLKKVQAGQQAAATTGIKDLETAWDADQPTLQPQDETAWHFLDSRIDAALKSLRTPTPDRPAEVKALSELLTALG